MYTHLMKSRPMILPIVFLVPVFGFSCLLFLEWESRGDQENKKEIGIEKLKINDDIHRSILMEEDPARDLMVPLQEALLMNDASTRRELMMDILYDDVGEYVEVLKNARMNDDTEVVHYATTAMVEPVSYTHLDVYKRQPYPGDLRRTAGQGFGGAASFDKRRGSDQRTDAGGQLPRKGIPGPCE